MRNQTGFIAFTSLIVIAAVALAISTSVALMGIDSAKGALSLSKGQETFAIAKSCLEEALIRLRADTNYAGGNLNVGNGSCAISLSGTGANRTITSTATLTGPPSYVKTIQIAVKRAGGSINVLSWQEL
jgi:hypothetical protein